MNPPLPVKIVPQSDSLYVSAAKIHPREIDGRFQRLRIAAVFWLLGMFYVFPWLNWGDRQLILFDLPERKFHVFWMTFWPQDFFLLSWLLILAALALFFFTALAGRLWCGYACPQTVWTEVFLWIERACEGRRNQRIRLDASPWNAEKLLRRGGKHLLWIVFALWTGFTFVGFFTPIRELGPALLRLEWSGWETFWVLFYGFATWGNAGFLREQVCKYMCPYARFQGAMFDRDSLIISYDAERGEPRGSRKRGADPKALGLGDCIDCKACVQVCPTGIDIRNGLQYECIACAACIDACDEIMDKMGYARGLVRYSSQNAIEGKPTRVLRPRILIYAALMLVFTTAFVVATLNRAPVTLEVLRDRNALYRETADGIENAYTLKIINRSERERSYRIELPESSGLDILGDDHVRVAAGAVHSHPLTLRASAGFAPGAHRLHIAIVSTDAEAHRASAETRFFAPLE